MERPRAPSFPVFAVLSASVHVAAFATVAARSATAPAPAFDPESQTLAGETLLVAPDAPLPSPDDTLAESESQSASPTPPASARGARITAAVGPRGAAAPKTAPAAPAFGAVGVRFATDLATTFTRALPQAGSADPAWSVAPFGSAGSADVALTLDEDGRLAATVVSGTPSTALRRALDRTLVLLGPRVFTARAAVTRLRIRAHVSRDDAHDGLHGDVFALSAGSFSGDVGTAFFALPPGASGTTGRRVDVEVRLLP